MTGENVLKACPFCGGAAEPEHLESGRWSVGCHDEGCIAYMSMLTFARRAEATAAWNTRSPVCEDAKELVEAITKVRDGYVSQMKFCDIEPLPYFREFVRRLNAALAKATRVPQ